MKNLKQKGADITIKNIIIHQIIKQAGDRTTVSKLSSVVINPSDNEKRFLANFHSAYFSKSNPIFGIFDGANPKFRNNLQEYINKKVSFLEFSKEETKLYENNIKNSAPASGGFLVFADYTKSDKHYLLVFTTNNKDGFVINDKLAIEGIKSIDMSKIDVACLINLDKYHQTQETDSDETYLSFVRGNKDISIYFLTYIDCKDKRSSKESSRQLIRAITDYADAKGWSEKDKDNKFEAIYGYCTSCMQQKNGIQLSTIANLINDKNPEDFIYFATSEKYSVSATVSGDRKMLKYLTNIYYKGEGLTITFDRSLISKRRIRYNKSKKELIIKDLPDELIAQLE